MNWEPIETAPKDEDVLLGHGVDWDAPLPMYWDSIAKEWVLDDLNIGGNGKKFGVMLAQQPTHWAYCPLPPAKQ